MKKVFISLLFCLVFCNTVFAQSYYFKKCQLSENVSADYIINFEKNVINIILTSTDGAVQEFTDKIKLITKNRVVSEIKKQENQQFSTQYFLDSDSKSVVRQLYKREIEIDLIRPEGLPKKTYCANVKANWYKTDEEKEKEREQKKIKLLEQSLKKKSSLAKCEGNDIEKWTSCRGTYLAEDGYKYIGEWENGKQEGVGIELYKDGRKYVGKFKNDNWHGKGTFTMLDGTKFVGIYKNGKKDGPGNFVWANGDKYVGEYKDGKESGKGVYTFASGTILSGQFKDGQIFKGNASYADGSKYTGDFNFDLPNGQGTLTYSNGGKYIGRFIDGYEYGEGICVKPNGLKNKCILPSMGIYLGRNKYNISIIGDWHKLEKQLESKEILITSFSNKASEHCILTGMGNFKELEKKTKVHEVDETPAFGLNPVYKLIIKGIVECQ